MTPERLERGRKISATKMANGIAKARSRCHRDGDTITITASSGDRFLIDAADERLCDFRWSVTGDGDHRYAVRRETVAGVTRKLWLHREVVAAPDGLDVDHINGNTLDNRRCNLRAVTRAENSKNRRTNRNSTSGVKGVWWSPRNRRWQAQIGMNRRKHHLGWFTSLADAAAAYREASKALFGPMHRET